MSVRRKLFVVFVLFLRRHEILSQSVRSSASKNNSKDLAGERIMQQLCFLLAQRVTSLDHHPHSVPRIMEVKSTVTSRVQDEYIWIDLLRGVRCLLTVVRLLTKQNSPP